MRTDTRTFAGLGVLLLAGLLAAAPTHRDAAEGPQDDAAATDAAADGAAWHLEATGARIIGGYGDNFAYDGKNVRPLEGSAEVKLNPAEGTGEVVVELRTTDASGPIHFSKDTKWSGEIRIVQKLNTEKMGKARIAEEVFLHGDTGNEAPVMPKIFNYFATWGPAAIWVNGEKAVPMIGSHTMFTEEARGSDGKIVRGSTVYHPMKVKDKTGFTDPGETEFHFVAHTSRPDEGNFPPHSAWIHLHFSDVEVTSKPSDVTIPYTETARASH